VKHMRKNILIINYYYPPINNGGVQRIRNFKKYLSSAGHNVSIITTNSYGSLEDDGENGIYRFPDKGYDYTHSSRNSKLGVFLFRAFRRMQVYMGFITDGKYYWKKEVIRGLDSILVDKQYDVVIASYPTPANLEIGEFIHEKYNIPLIIDYRDGLMYDPFPEIMKNFVLYRKRLKALEKRLAQKAVLHLTVNEPMNEYYSNKYPNVESVMISNGFDDEEIIDSEPVNLPKGINVLYTGAIGKSRKLYDFDKLSKVLNFIFTYSENINFVFIGDYENNELEFMKKYKNVYVMDKQSRNTIISTQRVADAFLLISGPKGATSGKLYEYMFAGRPILNIGGNEGIAKIIDDKNFGMTCEPEDLSKIAKFLKRLENKELTFDYEGKEKYTRRNQCNILLDYLNKR